MQNETLFVTKMEAQRIVESDKLKTGFAKDGPRLIRYSLADNVNEADVGMDYHVQLITIEDRPKVIKFLRRFFFRDEPLNHCIQLIPEGEDSTCEELECFSTEVIADNVSLMAVSTSGAIIGILLNAMPLSTSNHLGILYYYYYGPMGRVSPPQDDEPEYITACQNPKFKKILAIIHHLDKKTNLYEKYPNERCMEFRILSVDSSWRGRGIARALTEKALEICKENNVSIVYSECTSIFSGKLFASYGFKVISELKYEDYVDENGKPIFSPVPPHTAMAMYVKNL